MFSGQSDKLINQLNTVCDNIERKLAWPMLSTPPYDPMYTPQRTNRFSSPSPCPRHYSPNAHMLEYEDTIETFRPTKLAACSTLITTPTQTKNLSSEVSCQTKASIKKCVSVQHCHMGDAEPQLQQIPPTCAYPPPTCTAAIPLPPPLALPMPCGYDTTYVEEAQITCSVNNTGCQTERLEYCTIPTQYSCNKRSVPVQAGPACTIQVNEHPVVVKEEILQKSCPMRTCTSPSSSMESEDSLPTLTSLPMEYWQPPPKVLPKPKPCKPKVSPCRKNSNDCLNLASLNIDSPRCKNKPETGIYKDCRFHNVVQIHDNKKPPVICSASLVDLKELISCRTKFCIAEKLEKGKKLNPGECVCRDIFSNDVTLNNIDQIERDADYLAVKAAIDMSQGNKCTKYESSDNSICNIKRRISCDSRDECISDISCYPPRVSRKRSRHVEKANKRKRWQEQKHKRKTHQKPLYSMPCQRETDSEEEEEDEEEEEEEEEHFFINDCCRGNTDDGFNTVSSDGLLKRSTYSEIKSHIIGNLVRKSLKHGSSSSTDSLLRPPRRSHRKHKKKERKMKKKEVERTLRSTRYDTNEFEIYRSTENSSPFEPTNIQNEVPAVIESTDSFIKQPKIHIKLRKPNSSMRASKGYLSGHQNQGVGRRVSISISSKPSCTKQRTSDGSTQFKGRRTLIPVPVPLPLKITNQGPPPIPRVSRILQGVEAFKQSPTNDLNSNSEYIRGLLDFLKRTKKLVDEDRTEYIHVSASSTTEDSETGRHPEENEADTRETIIKQIDWTQVAKFFNK